MSEAVRPAKFSLSARILGAMFALVAVMYGVALGVLGVPLIERSEIELRLNAERELSALKTALQDQVLLRDYPAIEQTIRSRVARFRLLEVQYASRQVLIEARTPPRPHDYPEWLANWVDLSGAQAESELVIGGTSYGTLTVKLDPARTLHDLWSMGARFTLLAIGSLVVMLLLMRGLLAVSLRGLYELR